ncbi:hypothetical protein BN1723_015910 [Verticillium longisporum]|uniref:ATP-dependent DNA helicase II subunit 1 n=1 Tax=Verticillium longisporum TaxID=100787 RepID=A0A0G4N4L9_VERLO|nr:hypothetical protein BN1723_015910 [Verticillium longisporum]
MADRDDYKREDDEEADEEVENDYKSQNDAIILAIDVSDTMLEQPPASTSRKADKDSAVQAALKCAYQLMQQRIIASPKDMMGILFFGTEKSKFQEHSGRSGLGYPHCYLHIDLDIPAAEDVKALKALVEDEEDEDGVLIPSTTEKVQMANVFFCANQIFTTKAANYSSRRLFILTDNDSPHPSDKAAKSAAAVRAKDLYDLGVNIELFPITRGDNEFDLANFYDDIIYRDANAEANHSEVRYSKTADGLSLLNSLISNINSKQVAKRALFSSVPLEIAPGLRISIKGYNILHRQEPARSCYVWLEGEKPQIVAGETTRISEDTARTVEKSETKKAYKFGAEYIYFSPEDQKRAKDFGPPIIRIIGFKSRAHIPFWASVKKSTFIFPSEEDFVGSTRVFSALWQKLLKSNKVAIAWCIIRANATPVLSAIIPSHESTEESNATPFLPAGLWLYPLPFADDLRGGPATDGTEPPRASNELVDQMRVIVQQLQLPKAMYNPMRYPNPGLQWHYKILQALALEEEVPEVPEDLTLPKHKAINKRSGGYLQDWAETLQEETQKTAKTTKTKREADDDADDVKPAKKVKASSTKPSASGMTDAQVRAAATAGSLTKMVVADLKDLLAMKGLSISVHLNEQDHSKSLEIQCEGKRSYGLLGGTQPRSKRSYVAYSSVRSMVLQQDAYTLSATSSAFAMSYLKGFRIRLSPWSRSIPRAHRCLHLAPPFLLDDYVPRYTMLSSVDAAMKRSKAYAHLRNCSLCPRLCGVNRYETTGHCLVGDKAKVNVIAPHFGEEPCIQGHNGSGAVFFSGCNLRCVFCQNHGIAHQRNGQNLTPEDLGELYLKLQDVGGVHNINLVTPEHVAPQVALSILHARDLGLRLPIIYNTSSFDSLESLELMDGLVGDLCFTPDGIAKKGVLVRHLVMPGKEEEGKRIMQFLAEEVSKDCFVNVMEQYHPDAHVGKPRRRQGGKAAGSDISAESLRYSDINRAVSDQEVTSLRSAAEAVGLWRF